MSFSRELEHIRHALDKSAIVAVTNVGGDIIHVNDKFCEISQYSRDELLGKNHRIINSAHHPKSFFIGLWKTISAGQIWVGEIQNRAKDGSCYWVHTTIVPSLNQSGKPEEYVSIRFEITQRKQVEAQLKVYAERLEKSNKELEDFASIAAHDLQEPLRKIQTFAERLVSKYRVELSEEPKDYLDRMLSASKRMSHLIQDLLMYSKVSTQTQPFVMTDLKKIAEEVLSDLEIRIEQTKAQVILENLPIIQADPLQMRQLFQNFIGNSLKFYKQNTTPLIKVSARLEQGRCELEICDNGIGFDEKFSDKIFVIFQRLHSREAFEGTGVGLAICRKIIERHSGQISVSSKPNEGALFKISLPIQQQL
ncbi:MAG: PAS domain S-box protein [Deltaproteobacteria bacterium]|nr:PAS domain S-box protein [Deltaproteobacteria bacterium]